MSFKPSLHLGRAVSAIIIHHQVQGHLARELMVDATQEPQKLLVPVTRMAVADDFAGEHIECRKQSRRPMSLTISLNRPPLSSDGNHRCSSQF
jgi:hypothetical protein